MHCKRQMHDRVALTNLCYAERNHQGKDNILLFPIAGKARNHGGSSIDCNELSSGLLKYYHLDVA
jgi:hypothetical protein